MKSRQSIIPLPLRKEMAEDPFYKSCSLAGHVFEELQHQCAGSITWEHCLTYGGSKIQEKWAIIPLCEKYHGVNWFQDSGFMVKEINVWVALNRATDAELKAKSKVIPYLRERDRLNAKYGVWKPIVVLNMKPSNDVIDYGTFVWKDKMLMDMTRQELFTAFRELDEYHKNLAKESRQGMQSLFNLTPKS